MLSLSLPPSLSLSSFLTCMCGLVLLWELFHLTVLPSFHSFFPSTLLSVYTPKKSPLKISRNIIRKLTLHHTFSLMFFTCHLLSTLCLKRMQFLIFIFWVFSFIQCRSQCYFMEESLYFFQPPVFFFLSKTLFLSLFINLQDSSSCNAFFTHTLQLVF